MFPVAENTLVTEKKMLSGNPVFADYQATTPVDPRVLDTMEPYWRESFGNPHSSDHIIGWKAEKATRTATFSVGALIGADNDEIIFTSGATEANNLALLGLARHASSKRRHPVRRRILVSAIEHKCVLAAARQLEEREGYAVEHIPVNSKGIIRFDALEKMLGADVLLVSIMAVNNEIGAIQDIPRIARLLAPHGVFLHCDAAQSPCATDIGSLAEHAHLISLSGHKMYGPQGIGALYIRRELHNRIEPLFYGGGQQDGLRSGTLPLPLCVGMGAAASLCADQAMVAERERVARLRDAFVRLLRDSDISISVNGPAARYRHPGNANILFHGYSAQDLLAVLQPRLAASTGAACASGTQAPSHVLSATGLSAYDSDASIRFSFGRFSTAEDVERSAALVREAAASLAPVPTRQAAAA